MMLLSHFTHVVKMGVTPAPRTMATHQRSLSATATTFEKVEIDISKAMAGKQKSQEISSFMRLFFVLKRLEKQIFLIPKVLLRFFLRLFLIWSFTSFFSQYNPRILSKVSFVHQQHDTNSSVVFFLQAFLGPVIN